MIELLGVEDGDPIAGPSSRKPSLEAISSLMEIGIAHVERDELMGTHAHVGIGLRELAHDLRSPLGASMLLVDRMRKGVSGPLTAEMDRHLQLLQSAVSSMVRIVDDAFLLAQITENPTAPAIEHFSPAELFADVRALAQPLAEEKQLMLRFSSGFAERCPGNRARLQRIVLNLVVNALQNTATGGVTVVIDRVGQGQARISVRDSGDGLRGDIAEWLGGDERLPPQGVGIGLKLCKDLTNRLGATLTYGALPSGGSCFDLILPQSTES